MYQPVVLFLFFFANFQIFIRKEAGVSGFINRYRSVTLIRNNITTPNLILAKKMKHSIEIMKNSMMRTVLLIELP